MMNGLSSLYKTKSGIDTQVHMSVASTFICSLSFFPPSVMLA